MRDKKQTSSSRPGDLASRIDRRGALRAGLLGLGGLTLGDVIRFEAPAAPAVERLRQNRSTIILYMRGAPSQIDIWDLKPQAPLEIRGEFQPASTAAPGVQICELLPRSAAIMDKWSIVRSIEHLKEYGDVSHRRGDQVCFTGYSPGRDPDQNIHPCIGSVVARQLQNQDPSMLPYVITPKMFQGTRSAYLGPQWQPFETQADPAARGETFAVPNLAPPEGLATNRLEDRRELLEMFDRIRRDADRSGAIEAMDAYQRQAWEIVTGPRVREAFDLDAEPRRLRERYGFPPAFRSRILGGGANPGWNQRLLLARRLVEAGVRLVVVDMHNWDTHNEVFRSLKLGFLPQFDQCFSALIEDLDQRGLIDTTLVVAWGEHGRTPRVNEKGGRHHWMSAFSAAVAGGGVRGGRVVGETDAHAAVVKENPKHPQDVLATIYRHMGVDTTAQYSDHAGRPHPVLPFGQPIDELF